MNIERNYSGELSFIPSDLHGNVVALRLHLENDEVNIQYLELNLEYDNIKYTISLENFKKIGSFYSSRGVAKYVHPKYGVAKLDIHFKIFDIEMVDGDALLLTGLYWDCEKGSAISEAGVYFFEQLELELIKR